MNRGFLISFFVFSLALAYAQNPIIAWSKTSLGDAWHPGTEVTDPFDHQHFSSFLQDLVKSQGAPIVIYAIEGFSTNALIKYIESKAAHSTYLETASLKSASSRIYTDSALSYTELLQAIETSEPGKVQTFSIKDKTALPDFGSEPNAPKVLLLFLETSNIEDNIDLIETLDGQRKTNSISMLVGYGKAKAETRFLQVVSQNQTDDKVNATATGGLMVSLMVALVAVFGLVMMANIQTPKSFARRDLVKGKINK